MLQLILHLWGDYALQPQKWALGKRNSIKYAAFHGLQYGLVFALASWLIPAFNLSWMALAVITVSHAIIDRSYPARHLIFAKNWVVDRGLMWSECRQTGYPPSTPVWMSVWLMIVVDNLLHITINYAAIEWL